MSAVPPILSRSNEVIQSSSMRDFDAIELIGKRLELLRTPTQRELTGCQVQQRRIHPIARHRCTTCWSARSKNNRNCRMASTASVVALRGPSTIGSRCSISATDLRRLETPTRTGSRVQSPAAQETSCKATRMSQHSSVIRPSRMR